MKWLAVNLGLLGALLVLPHLAQGNSGELSTLRQCLRQWNDQPFGTIDEKTKYRVLDTQVRVLGIGGETVDEKVTKKPQLVLVKPSVSVLSKTTFRLMNPNGYYCFKGKVTVLAKSVIEADCKTHIASSEGVTVLGSDEGAARKQGVTVLGKTRIRRLNCE